MKRCFSCFREYQDAYHVCPFCGSPEIVKPSEPVHLVPGTVLYNRYVIGLAVGAGGFGIVYKAWDLKFETVVAVKEFYVSRIMTRAEGLKNVIVSKKYAEEFGYRKERFLAEARNMAKFGAHRNIPNVFEVFEENNTAYIVMELMQGQTLSEYLHEHSGSINMDFALQIANEVGNALKSMHEQNIIHRDVAPDNIFICNDNEIRIKLMDFGAAKLADSTDAVIDIILKPGYSPVEQYDNSKNIGPWSDIYAMGATMYMMLTGVKPSESTNRKISDDVVPPRQLNPNISENLNNTIMKAMAIDRHMRFKSIDDFLSAINNEIRVIPVEKERKYRTLKRAAGITAALLAVVIGSGVVLHTFFNKQKEGVLEDANLEVWYSVEDGSNEDKAMNAIRKDFEKKYENVSLELVPIPAAEYQQTVEQAAREDRLPDLFESSGLPRELLKKTEDLDRVIGSQQFENALFLDQYEKCYSDHKQMPLAIEVPMAYVITSGASEIAYTNGVFGTLEDFGGSKTNIAVDERHEALIRENFGSGSFCGRKEFLNNEKNTSPVLLSTTMALNEVRTTLTNFEKTYVHYDADPITCGFIYEWSIAEGEEAEVAAAERLLSWMLGNVYQSYLMVTECSDGQIPVSKLCFDTKLESNYLAELKNLYPRFTFRKLN